MEIYINGVYNAMSSRPNSAAVEVKILKAEMKSFKESSDQRDEIMSRLVETQHMLAKKIVAIETNQIHQGEQIGLIRKDSSLQNKLLVAILGALFSGMAALIIKLMVG